MKLHDQVYVECEYSEQLPFRWNATKVKLLNSMQNRGQQASTYLQHRMQQMMHQQQHQQTIQQNTIQQNAIQQNTSLAPAAQQALQNLAPELRKLIEKQQQQPQPQIQNFQQQQQQNNQPPPFNNRQNDYNQSPAPFTGQITYTSTPGKCA